MRETIDAQTFVNMIRCAASAMNENINTVNDLNVFPVPDGDTGTNMALTLNNAVSELKKRAFTSLSAAADCVASALLRGARGNSGVILSLLWRGFAKRIKGLTTVNAREFSLAMEDGAAAAYRSVMKPAEGTILSVSRTAAAAAVSAADTGADAEGCLVHAVAAGDEALNETVKINPVLKKAGVVDAGGMGFMIILRAMLAYLRGETAVPEGDRPAEKPAVFNAFSPDDITFAYDTVYIVRKTAPNTGLEPLRAYLSSIGDSLVIGEDDESFKVHVHTNAPGDALSEAQKYGVLELAKIENMRTQHEKLMTGQRPRSADSLEDEETAETEGKKLGIVAVCAGEGIEELFRELGADGIVHGGQTMNPSTEDILRETEKLSAPTVLVLPNNKNIIMAAEQCRSLSSKKIIVIPSKTVPQGIAALLSLDDNTPEPELAESLEEAMANVHTAMITCAARDSVFNGRSIRKGEYLTLLDGVLTGNCGDIRTLFTELGHALSEFSPELVSVYSGLDADEAATDMALELLSACLPDAEISYIRGGQPVYSYMIAAE